MAKRRSTTLRKQKRPSKRASLPRDVELTCNFHRGWERLTHSGRYDIAHFKAVMLLLIANDAPLQPEWRDHALTGEWSNRRECHIGGDFLVIYRIIAGGKGETIYFERAGTHSELIE